MSILVRCARCKLFVLSSLHLAFARSINTNSSLRRIQRFMVTYLLDTDLISRLIFRLLPHNSPSRFALDRINTKFGQMNINIGVRSCLIRS